MRLFAGTEWDQPPTCERCGGLEAECNCPAAKKTAQSKTAPNQQARVRQTARLAVEKRKRGKLMTVVRGLAAAENDLPALLTQLKNHCGAGGTVKDDSLEIQGDHLLRIQQVLSEFGYRVRE